MTSEGPRDRTPDGGSLDGGLLRDRPEDPLRGTWVADGVQDALRRVDLLTRELDQVETVLRTQSEDVSRLRDSLQVVEGRTTRHEAGQEQTREVRQELSELGERLAQEAALRRDLVAQVERFRGRDAENQQELFRALQVIATRLDEIDGRASAETLRQRHFADEIAEVGHEGDGVEARLEALERRVAAEFEGNRHLGTEVARLASSITGLMSALEAAEARSRAVTLDQHRLDEEVAALRAVRDREAELREVIAQQRANRARLEDRMTQIEERIEELARAVAESSEARALLQRQVAGEAEQRRALTERIEGQRDTFLEHMRRQVKAEQASHRRVIEDMEREIRLSRQLLVRLSEDTDESEQEHPL
ncbi:MAG: hypothetical protein M0R75_13190 [Dehalococcoidia bacterium]|nr:hypothetical protein [Dehalococcoidia bacterium]